MQNMHGFGRIPQGYVPYSTLVPFLADHLKPLDRRELEAPSFLRSALLTQQHKSKCTSASWYLITLTLHQHSAR